MGHTGTEDTDNGPKLKHKKYAGNRCHQAAATADQLPSGLVGSKSVAEVTIGGIQYSCLIDSGSQVTTLSKSFHETHLPSHSILPLANLLEIEGAAGQRVPYLGYIEVDIGFPASFTGESKMVRTLALIVPDHRVSDQVPVLIGTNALDTLYDGFNKKRAISEPCAYAPLIQHLQSIYRNKTQQDGKVGRVKLQCKSGIVIPAGQKIALNGRTRNAPTAPGVNLLVEPPTHSSLPGGLVFCSYIMSSPRQTSFKVPILLKN